MKKWMYEICIVIITLVIGSSGWYWSSTKDNRAENAELETMIKYAQRQALEIAIIEQASKLTNYRKQLATAQQTEITIPQESIADPKDVPIDD